MAAMLLLERLTPLERAAFVLREVFGFSFPEIASAVGRSDAACRQLAVRARRHMDAGRPRFEADRREREEIASPCFELVHTRDRALAQRVDDKEVGIDLHAGRPRPRWRIVTSTWSPASTNSSAVTSRFSQALAHRSKLSRIEPQP
jgi:RNA polymerase sigma-70 factor (ECF subfamily)